MSSPIEVLPGITRVSKDFRGVLLDAYGVFWEGNIAGLLPGAKEAMEKLVSQGKIVGILSNSTQLASKEIHKLHGHGLIQGSHFHFLMTSGEVARSLFLGEELPFETTRKNFALFGQAHPKFSSHQAIFQGSIYQETADISEADFVYLSIPHIRGEDQIDPEVFRKDLEELKKYNLPLICANPDRFAHEGFPPRAVVRQGSLALLYEEMGGKVFYIGKPHQMSYQASMKLFEKWGIQNPSDLLMVGDTPETDIRGARSFGMSSALLTQTGIMADRIQRQGFEAAIKALPLNEIPDYFIERLIDDI